MINVLAIDAYGLTEFPHHANMGWSCFLNIAIAIFLLYSQIGIAGIAGTLVMIILLPITSFITNKVFFIIKIFYYPELSHKEKIIKKKFLTLFAVIYATK